MLHEGAPASITNLTKRTRPGEPPDRSIEQPAPRRVPAELLPSSLNGYGPDGNALLHWPPMSPAC